MKKLLLFMLFFSAAAVGQGSRYDSVALGPKGPIPNAIITLCSSAGTGLPCSPVVQSFTDATLGTACASGFAVTLPGSSNCQNTTDALGNFGFWLSPGSYRYSITAPNVSGKTYDITVVQSSNLHYCGGSDGVIDVSGVADSSAAVQACINNAYTANQTAVLPSTPPTGGILIGTALNLTNKPGMKMQGTAWTLSNGVGSNFGTIIKCSTGTPVGNTSGVCIDTTGSPNMELSNFQIISFTSPVAILMGRDNAGAPSGGGQNCFQSNFNFHDIGINMVPNLSANGGAGAIGIVNLAAEDGNFTNVEILGDTPMWSGNLNPIPFVSPYQTTLTGCNNATMTNVNFINVNFQATNITRPTFYCNNCSRMKFYGGRFGAGNTSIKADNTSGTDAGHDWHIESSEEDVAGPLITITGSIDNWFIHTSDEQTGVNALTAILNPTNNNLTISNLRAFTNTASVPFITNTATGTKITGSEFIVEAATSASNVTVTSSRVIAPTLTDSQVSFNASSQYDLFDATVSSSGIITKGNRYVAGTLNAFNVTANGAGGSPATQCGFGGDICTDRSGGVTGSVWFGNAVANIDFGLTTANIFTASNAWTAPTYRTSTNCSSAASPAVCGSAASGNFVVAAAATTVTVNTSAVTTNSQIFLQADDSLGTKLSVTCNTTAATLAAAPWVSARVNGTSFTVNLTAAPTTNPECFSYHIVN